MSNLEKEFEYDDFDDAVDLVLATDREIDEAIERAEEVADSKDAESVIAMMQENGDLSCDLTEEDEELIAESIVKNFVADFYTWTNKEGQYDIGGMDYVYTPQKTNIYDEARNGFYKTFEQSVEAYGQDETLEIDEVSASAVALSGGYDLEEDGVSVHFSDAFTVDCDFSYADTDMDKSALETRQTFIVIKDQETGRYEIVEALGGEDVTQE